MAISMGALGTRRQGCIDLIALGAPDHNDLRCAEVQGGTNRVVDHRSASDRVQYLGTL